MRELGAPLNYGEPVPLAVCIFDKVILSHPRFQKIDFVCNSDHMVCKNA